MYRSETVIAWAIHVFTAAGAAVGLLTLVALEAGNFRLAVSLGLAALVIDAVDGSLARWAKVREWAPGLDGRRLDDIVDYLNYAVVPAFFMLSSGSLAHPAWACLPVLASAYGFSRSDAKTDDHFFLGFPSYWNVLALYLWWYAAPTWVGALWVSVLFLASYPRLRFIYPSRMGRWRGLTCWLGACWIGSVGLAVYTEHGRLAESLMAVSLLYPIYYAAVSAWLGGWFRNGP